MAVRTHLGLLHDEKMNDVLENLKYVISIKKGAFAQPKKKEKKVYIRFLQYLTIHYR